MGKQNYIYLLGIIKWINLMTLFVLLFGAFAALNIPSIMSLFILMILVSIISFFLNKWFENRYGAENLIENTLAFKIIAGMFAFSALLFSWLMGQRMLVLIIVGFMVLQISIFKLVAVIKKKKGA